VILTEFICPRKWASQDFRGHKISGATALPATLSRRTGPRSNLLNPSRIIAPSYEVWLEAAMLASVLARTQSIQKQDRRKFLNDTLLFLQAANSGATLVSSRRTRAENGQLASLRQEPKTEVLDRPGAAHKRNDIGMRFAGEPSPDAWRRPIEVKRDWATQFRQRSDRDRPPANLCQQVDHSICRSSVCNCRRKSCTCRRSSNASRV
jgi:hypothetical protein